MTFLFDISPAEPPDSKKKAVKKAVSQPAAEVVSEPIFLPAQRELRIIGRIDHTYACERARCGAQCHDIIAEDMGDWLLECCFCGQWQWAPAVEGVLDTGSEEFRFRDGRFSGMTVEEASAQEHGLDYIKWAAQSHKREAVRLACISWLDSSSVAP
jgi:hypothetical protein